MSKEAFVLICGVFVFLMPFLGIPGEWKKWGLILIGALLIIVGYLLRRKAFLHSIESETGERRADVFVESHTKNQATTSGEKVSDV